MASFFNKSQNISQNCLIIVFSSTIINGMRIFFVADAHNCQEQYNLLTNSFPTSEIITFIEKKNQDTFNVSCPAIVYFTGSVTEAFTPYMAKKDSLIVFASANADELMYSQIAQYSYNHDVIFVRRRLPNFFTRICAKFYNLFVRAFLGKHDSCASSKIVYLSAKAMETNAENGAKFRFINDSSLRTTEIYYTSGVKPIKTKGKVNKECWITPLILLGVIGLAVLLDCLVTLPFLVQIGFDFIMVLLVLIEVAMLFKNKLDNRIEGKK